MKISEQEIKDIIKDNFESPSFGFSTRTMRLIEKKQSLNEIYTPLKISRWVLRGVLSALAICILYSLTIDPISFKYTIQPILPQFSIFWMWGLTFFGMAIGLWVWILLFKNGKIRIN